MQMQLSSVYGNMRQNRSHPLTEALYKDLCANSFYPFIIFIGLAINAA